MSAAFEPKQEEGFAGVTVPVKTSFEPSAIQ